MENISDSHIRAKLTEAFVQATGVNPDEIQSVQQSGSRRKYYRLKAANISLIGTFSPDPDETKAFISLTSYFSSRNLPVPEMVYYSPGSDVYLQTDLGDVSLHDHLQSSDITEDQKNELYRLALSNLISIQTSVSPELDFSVCYPRKAFDTGSMMWDLDYFKYSFLKPGNIEFHEERLQVDFHLLVKRACEADTHYFLYRDFQLRNIMVGNDNKLYFIDYQGGRQGALQYDPASFIYGARMPLTLEQKDALLEYYKEELVKNSIDISSFDKYFPYYLLLRILQALGAYGYRGWLERKDAFLNILPQAVGNLKELLPRFTFLSEMPELTNAISQVIEKFGKQPEVKKLSSDTLTVKVFSFSYKNKFPVDNSGNGGGFVFDCRLLPNPGKYDQYKQQSGLDAEVKSFLLSEPEVATFLSNVTSIVAQSVEKYIARDFSSLMISFGCTGGQHRSVYCAEKTAAFIRSRFGVKVEVVHCEQNTWRKDDAK